MKIKLFIFSLLFSTIGLSAQDNQFKFSLEEAIEHALINNRSAKNAALDIEAAKQQKWETTSTGLPQISATVDYQNWLKQQVSLIPAEFFGGNEGEFAEVAFGTKQNLNATATLNQLLFDGSYLVGLQSAKVFLEISENAKIKTDLEVKKAVIQAYGNVLLAEESVKIIDKNLQVLQKNLAETEKIFQNGLEEEESVEQLKITLSSVQSSKSNTERLRKLAYQMLNITLGLSIESEIELKDNLEDLTTDHINLPLLSADENIKNNIDFKIAVNDKVSKELLLKLEKSKALPRLSAFVNGAYTGNSNSFDFLKKEQRWFGSSLLGVSLNIPIFSSGGRSAATQMAKINLTKSEEDLIQVEEELKLKINSAKSDYQFAIEEYRNKKDNLQLAERIEQKNQTKFFEGIASSFELRQAQTQLYSIQQEYLQTMLDVITKKTALEILLNSSN